MSFRDVRKFAETMRILQYGRVVSVQSFQQPNFELVADLLYWMVKRYDPNIMIHESIDTEKDRVCFITGIVRDFYHKSNIKLNTKNLYLADGHSVKELLKIASFLCQSMTVIDEEEAGRRSSGNSGSSGSSSTHGNSRSNHDTNSTNRINNPLMSFIKSDDKSLSSNLINLQDVKELRRLASEVTERGAKIYELLRIEQKDKEKREEGLKFLDAASSGFDDCSELQHVESILLRNLEEKKNEVDNIGRECQVMESDKNDLLEDMKKKTLDLERNKKRLESIQSARPAFMDEYEQLEVELQKHYDLYMERYRNVHYLKKEMEKFQKEEEEKLNEVERTKKKMQSKIQEEELKILRGDYSPNGKQKQKANLSQGTVSRMDDVAVPLLDTTDDSSIIIHADNDDDHVHDSEIFLDDDVHLSVDGDSSFDASTKRRSASSRDGSQTILSSKASLFSIEGEFSNNGTDDDSDGMTFNKSTDSDDNF